MNVITPLRIVAVILIGFIAIIGFYWIFTPEPIEDNEGWEYDDYLTADNVTKADGSLEIITNESGLKFIHAHKLGPGSYTIDNKTYEVYVKKAKLDVIFMTGQSNAAYREADPSTAYPLPNVGECYYFGFSDHYDFLDDTATMRPAVDINGNALIGDKCPPMCAEITKITGNKTYFVCGAIGGKGIRSFNPDNGPTWDYMKNVIQWSINAVDHEKYELKWGGYAWIQGETDIHQTIAYYKEWFLKMHDAIIAGQLGVDLKKCFICLPSWFWGGNSRAAQIELSHEYPNTIEIAADSEGFTWTNGLLSPTDHIHYTQKGDNITGSDLGKAYGYWLGGYSEGKITVPSGIMGDLIWIAPVVSVVAFIAGITMRRFLE